MKKLIVFIAFILSVVCAYSQTDGISSKEPRKGYRGFVDLSGEALFERKYSNDRDIVYSASGITTTHGYQFNEHFFVGGGAGISFLTYNFKDQGATFGIDCSVFAAGRADWRIGKVPRFADLRVGTFITSRTGHNDDRMFISPVVGYHCSWGRKVSLNIGAGLSFHLIDRNNDSDWELMPSVRIGIEFN